MPTVKRTEREVETRPVAAREIPIETAEVPLQKTQAALDKTTAKLFEDERLKASKLVMSENETLFQQLELAQDAEGGAFTQKGRDAVGVAHSTLIGFDKMSSELINKAPNEETTILTTEMARRYRTRLQGRLNKHEFDQYEVVQAEVYASGTKTAIDYASSADVNLVPGLKQAEVDTREFWRDQGKDKSFVDVKIQEVQSAIIIGSIARKRAEGRDDEALELFNDKRSQKILSTDQKTDLKPKLEDGSRLQKAQRRTDEIILEGGTPESQLKKARSITAGKLRDEVVKRVTARNREEDANREETVKANNEETWLELENLRRDGVPDGQLQPIIDSVEPRSERAKMNTWLAIPGKVLKEERKIEQQINYERLTLRTPGELRGEDLKSMVRVGDLSRVGFAALKGQADPRNSQRAKNANKVLSDARTKKLFNSNDLENEKQWAETSDMLANFIVNHPDEDYGEFAIELLKPIKLTWIDELMNFISIGQPATEEAIRRRDEELARQAGRELITPEPSIAPALPTAINPNTGERMIFKDGTWQSLTK